MNRILKLTVGLAAALVLAVGLAPTSVAVPPAAAVTAPFIFDADGSGLPTALAAADWSQNTGITVTSGNCTTGNHCVHFKKVQFACGTGAPGCAYGLADGSCQVEVNNYLITLPGREYLDDLITKHEGGHCIFRAGGKAVSFHLPESPHCLMSATHSGSPTKKQATLYSTDRSFTRSLFGG